jgi:hypothetical protein
MIYNIIQLIHIIIILLFIISLFYPNKEFKKIILSVVILLLIKYILGYERCGLTEIEYLFKGERYKEGFIYRIIKPIIVIPESYFKNCLFIIHLIYITILYYQIQ